MKEIEYNLLDEPWIRVMKPDCSVIEVSLTDALIHAHEFEDLAGEMPTQDIAVMRLLLAVLQTIFSRTNADGNPDPVDKDNALERWGELWNLGKFPNKPVLDYLNRWHDRFWLFHPERPFYQVPGAEKGSKYSAPKLNGEISESNNKKRLFSSRSGFGKDNLDYDEAARWLVNLIAFDDSSVKSNSGTGSGWLGRLGLITAQGNNLFETLMLNLIFLKNGNKEWKSPLPVWESENPKTAEKCEIPVPDNLPELYTIQSRRIILQRENDHVSGFYSMGGDYFTEDTGNEQMTLWRVQCNSKGERTGISPLKHDFSKQVWRNFSLIASQDHSIQKPGIVLWINNLIDEEILEEERLLRFRFSSIKYDEKGQSIVDYFNDFLSFNINLLSDKGAEWVAIVEKEISSLEKIANMIWKLSKNISIAAGNRGSDQANYDKELFYYQINDPFRLWLNKLSADQEDEEITQLREEWHAFAKSTARKIGQKIVDDSGPQAFIGRKGTVEKGKKGKKNAQDNKTQEYLYSAPQAFNVFLNELNHVYDSKGV